MKDLIITLVTNVNGARMRRYIDNLFIGQGRAKSSIAIWKELLDTDEFAGIKKMYLTGDTGSGFRSYEMLMFLSTIKGTWDIEVEIHFLCPRHAFSLCDAHGWIVAEIFHHVKLSGWLQTPGGN